MNYEELVKALRHCMTKEDGITICEPCPYYGKGIECENVLHTDAAAAIEELQAEIRESMQKCAECGDRMVEPKQGEMYFLEYDNPETGEYEQTYFQCSVCGKYFYGIDECEAKHFNYCPNCGAKMEVQDGSSR